MAESTERSNSSKQYKQKFKKSWINLPEYRGWLTQNKRTQSARCELCGIDLQGSITQIKRHHDSKKHQKNKKSVQSSNVNGYFQKKEENEEMRFQNQLKSSELKIVAFLSEHNLPISLMDHLPKLLESTLPDSKIAKELKCGRTKATYLMKNAIAREEFQAVIMALRNNMFSLIIDESTDIGETQHVVIIARFVDTNQNAVRDVFVTLLEITTDSRAKSLFSLVKTLFEENKVPLKNIMGFASDNCNVMMGAKSGFVTLLKEEVPDVFTLGCICHSFHLCASSASKMLPESVEQLTRNICNTVRGSPKCLRLLKEFQDFCQEINHKIPKLSTTRWLSHEAVISRIVNQWNPLLLFFQDQGLSEKNESCKEIWRAMLNPVFKAYFYFLNYVLGTVKKLNLLFQSEQVKIHLLLSVVGKEFKSLCLNFMKKDYVNETAVEDIDISNGSKTFCSLDKIYLGARVEALVAKGELAHSDLISVRIKCRSFLIELCTEIRKRINFKDPVLKALKLLNPQSVTQASSVVPLAAVHFPQLISENVYEELNLEWRNVPLCKNIPVPTADDLDPVTFWVAVSKQKNEVTGNQEFPVLSKLMLQLVALPHSSACAERLFSLVTIVKNK